MWYYVQNGEQQGPLDETGLDGLIAQGVVTPETLVWKEGLANWAALKEARPASANIAAMPPLPVVTTKEATCSMCKSVVGEDNLIELGGRRVCAACKPKALQAMREGAAILGADTAWSEGKNMVVCDDIPLPQRCVKCNHAPVVEPPLKRKLFWHPPVYYLILVLSVLGGVGILGYLVVMVFVRKKATTHFYLCEQHAKQRKIFSIIMGTGFTVGFLMLMGGIVSNTPVLTGIAGMLLMIFLLVIVIAGLIPGFVGLRVVRPTRIKDNRIWLRGAGKEFLASLPRWTGH